MKNGSSVAVLTQSERAVRGLRVQKLRCDEVELFKPPIWRAAQLITQSKKRDEGMVAGVVEAMSTLHAPFGLMQDIIDQAETAGTRIIRWCLLEVLEKCPPERDCNACPLWEDCLGVAKTRCDGFVLIDDAIAMKRRASRESWDSEMLCRRPTVTGCVFPHFDRDIHVREQAPRAAALVDDDHAAPLGKSLAIDFGFRGAFVCLWIDTLSGGVTHVFDEYFQPQLMIHEHVQEIEARPWGKAMRIACDPAGNGINDQTAASDVTYLRTRGYTVKTRHSRIVDGVEMIRAALRPASGEPRLYIHPRCKMLIRAMQSYRYPDRGGEIPDKDGTHDHLMDALRYHYINRPNTPARRRRY